MSSSKINLELLSQELGFDSHTTARYIQEFRQYLPEQRDDWSESTARLKILAPLKTIKNIVSNTKFANFASVLGASAEGAKISAEIGPFFDKSNKSLLSRYSLSGSTAGVYSAAHRLISTHEPGERNTPRLDAFVQQKASIENALDGVFELKGAVSEGIGEIEIGAELKYEDEGFCFPAQIIRCPAFPTQDAPMPALDLNFMTWTDEQRERGLYVVQISNDGSLPNAFFRDADFEALRPDDTKFFQSVYLDQTPFQFCVNPQNDRRLHEVFVEKYDLSSRSVYFKTRPVNPRIEKGNQRRE